MSQVESKDNSGANVKYSTSPDDYELITEIGQGGAGSVYLAQCKNPPAKVAVKILDLEKNGKIVKEVQIMRSLDHENVVHIYCSFTDGQYLWIVMPFLSGGSCRRLLNLLSPGGFKDEALIATILYETLKGIEYFHKDGKIHRDVKAGNILISEKGDVMIADFGVSGEIIESGINRQRQTFVGTPSWMAPEVLDPPQNGGYNTKADIWSFGITALELGFGKPPYADMPPAKIFLKTLADDPPTPDLYDDQTYKFSDSYRQLVADCLKKEPKERPTAEKLLKHPFFKKAKKTSYLAEKLIKLVEPLGGDVKSYQAAITPPSSSVNANACVPVGDFVFSDKEAKQADSSKPVKDQAPSHVGRFIVEEDVPSNQASPDLQHASKFIVEDLDQVSEFQLVNNGNKAKTKSPPAKGT